MKQEMNNESNKFFMLPALTTRHGWMAGNDDLKCRLEPLECDYRDILRLACGEASSKRTLTGLIRPVTMVDDGRPMFMSCGQASSCDLFALCLSVKDRKGVLVVDMQQKPEALLKTMLYVHLLDAGMVMDQANLRNFNLAKDYRSPDEDCRVEILMDSALPASGNLYRDKIGPLTDEAEWRYPTMDIDPEMNPGPLPVAVVFHNVRFRTYKVNIWNAEDAIIDSELFLVVDPDDVPAGAIFDNGTDDGTLWNGMFWHGTLRTSEFPDEDYYLVCHEEAVIRWLRKFSLDASGAKRVICPDGHLDSGMKARMNAHGFQVFDMSIG